MFLFMYAKDFDKHDFKNQSIYEIGKAPEGFPSFEYMWTQIFFYGNLGVNFGEENFTVYFLDSYELTDMFTSGNVSILTPYSYDAHGNIGIYKITPNLNIENFRESLIGFISSLSSGIYYIEEMDTLIIGRLQSDRSDIGKLLVGYKRNGTLFFIKNFIVG